MQTTVERDAGITGLFRTFNLETPLTFDAATALRKVLKEATQYACLSRPEREVCMDMIDSIDRVLAQLSR